MPATFANTIQRWFSANARELPWRDPAASAYAIMVSEFMLQQTPVSRVLPRWQAWLQRWPTAADLARADSAEVIRAWDRLGYPRRALRLHAAAQQIEQEYDGVVPASEQQLRELPGVGQYTAAAITAFAFGKRSVVLDTNVRRVLARTHAGIANPPATLGRAEWELAESLVPRSNKAAAKYNAGIMELGALVCTARKPACQVCPVAQQCAWLQAGKPESAVAPKTQSWHGSDRQVRGAIMAVLRNSESAVPLAELRNIRIRADHTHPVPPVQFQRALDGLVKDGLASTDGASYTLP